MSSENVSYLEKYLPTDEPPAAPKTQAPAVETSKAGSYLEKYLPADDAKAIATYEQEMPYFEAKAQQIEQQAMDQTRADNTEKYSAPMRGLLSGIDSAESMVGGAVALIGKAANIDVLRDWGLDFYQEQSRQASMYEKPKFSDDKLGWVGFTAGNFLPSMAEAVGGALIGSAVAPGPGTVGGAFLGKTILKKAIKELTEKLVKQNVARETAQKVATGKLLKAFGAKAGMVGATWQMEAGGNFGEAVDEYGVDDASVTAALGTGLASSLLERAGGNARFIDAVLGTKAGKVFSEAVKKGDSYLVARMVKEAAIQMPPEAGQELGQEFLSLVNLKLNDPNYEIFTPKNLWRMGEAAGAGAVGGGLGAGPTALFNGPKKQDQRTNGPAGSNAASETPAAPNQVTPPPAQLVVQQLHQSRTQAATTGGDALDVAAAGAGVAVESSAASAEVPSSVVSTDVPTVPAAPPIAERELRSIPPSPVEHQNTSPLRRIAAELKPLQDQLQRDGFLPPELVARFQALAQEAKRLIESTMAGQAAAQTPTEDVNNDLSRVSQETGQAPQVSPVRGADEIGQGVSGVTPSVTPSVTPLSMPVDAGPVFQAERWDALPKEERAKVVVQAGYTKKNGELNAYGQKMLEKPAADFAPTVQSKLARSMPVVAPMETSSISQGVNSGDLVQGDRPQALRVGSRFVRDGIIYQVDTISQGQIEAVDLDSGALETWNSPQEFQADTGQVVELIDQGNAPAPQIQLSTSKEVHYDGAAPVAVPLVARGDEVLAQVDDNVQVDMTVLQQRFDEAQELVNCVRRHA